MKLLIRACTRSGTQFTTKLLQDAGIQFGHERILKHGGIGWQVSYKQGKFLKQFDHIIHQVRNPVRAVQSYHTHNKNALRRKSELFNIKTKNNILWGMLFWLKFNRICEKAEFTYKVEDLNPNSFISNKLSKWFKVKLKDFPRVDYNSRKNRTTYISLSFKDLIKTDEKVTKEIVKLAKQYGYTEEELTNV